MSQKSCAAHVLMYAKTSQNRQMWTSAAHNTRRGDHRGLRSESLDIIVPE